MVDKVDIFPNPHETIPPSNDFEAIEYAFRFWGLETSRSEAKERVDSMDPTRIVKAVQGYLVQPPLNPFELHLSGTVEYCISEGLLDTPLGAVAVLEAVRQEVQNGGVFIGEEVSKVEPAGEREYYVNDHAYPTVAGWRDDLEAQGLLEPRSTDS